MRDPATRRSAVNRLAALAIFVLVAGAAVAQNLGDPRRGFAYAVDVCSQCHAVELGDHDSPIYEAPSFQEVADDPAMTQIALTVFFQTSHPSMPNLIVPTDDARDLIAYILSLKD
jgi:mono/diheme cytochrome c family protein